MTNESKQSPTSGKPASVSRMSRSVESVTVTLGIVRLRSLTEGGENPGTGTFVPGRGVIFEADAERGRALIACGMAELAPVGAKEGE